MTAEERRLEQERDEFAAAIVEAAAIYSEDGTGSPIIYCAFCGQSGVKGGPFVTAAGHPHKPDCIVLRAKELLGRGA